jgi:hypothetical protein
MKTNHPEPNMPEEDLDDKYIDQWLDENTDKIVTPEFINYINTHLEYVPIVEYAFTKGNRIANAILQAMTKAPTKNMDLDPTRFIGNQRLFKLGECIIYGEGADENNVVNDIGKSIYIGEDARIYVTIDHHYTKLNDDASTNGYITLHQQVSEETYDKYDIKIKNSELEMLLENILNYMPKDIYDAIRAC